VSSYAIAAFPMACNSRVGIESGLPGRAMAIHELDDIDELVRTHRARILRLVAYSTGDPDLAESVAQDALLRAYNSRGDFRAESSVKTWITGIAIHVMRDHLRTKRYQFWRRVKSTALDVHEMASFIASEGIDPESVLLAREKFQRLSKELEALSHNQRTIFLMKFSEEMSVDEIGATLGMSVNTVRTHLHRALKAVRGRLGERI